jgi:hypothetical protein
MQVIARTVGLEAHPGLPAPGSSLPGQVQKKYPHPPLTPGGYQFLPEFLVKIDV